MIIALCFLLSTRSSFQQRKKKAEQKIIKLKVNNECVGILIWEGGINVVIVLLLNF
jgi:hypothetical protein